MIFYKIMMEGTSWNMKPMPVIFLFSATRECFSSMWNFDLQSCLKIVR